MSFLKNAYKALAVILSLTLVLSLCACGDKDDSSAYSDPLYYVETETYGYNVYEDHVELEKFMGSNSMEVKIPAEFKDSNSGKTLPLTVIGRAAFSANTGTQSLVIPDSVTEICSGAFHDCIGLEKVTIGKNVKIIGNSAFSGCLGITEITIPDSCEKIGAYAFTHCSTMSKVKLANVKEIGDFAFEKCISVETVEGGEKLEKIGANAFSDTPWFNSKTEEFGVLGNVLIKYNGDGAEVTVPENILGISNVFAGKDDLTKVEMPSVKNICNNAFDGCKNLSEIKFSDKAEFIGSRAFNGTPYLDGLSFDKNGFAIVGDGVLLKYNGSAESLRIPKSVKMISDAFLGNENLRDVAMEKSVSYIGMDAFTNCRHLDTVVIGEGVTFIDDNAFDNCPITEYNAGANGYARVWGRSYGIKNVIYEGMDKESEE